MATTSSNLAASNPIAGRRGNGKGNKGRAAGLIATAALGLSLVAGGAFGHEWLVAQHDAPSANAIPFASDAHDYTMWDFREDHRVAATAVVPDQFTYREDHWADRPFPAWPPTTGLPTGTRASGERHPTRQRAARVHCSGIGQVAVMGRDAAAAHTAGIDDRHRW